MKTFSRFSALFAAGIIYTSGVANAENSVSAETGVAECATIDGSLQRLQCFDDLADRLQLDGPQAVEVEISDNGKWQVSQRVNPLDDSETVVLSLIASEGRSAWGKQIGLIVRCQSNKTEMYINWNDYLGNDGSFDKSYKLVSTRIGKDQTKTNRWDLSTDSKATFTPGSPINMLRDMAKVDTFVAQTTPYNEAPITAIFDIAGLDNALKPLMDVCDWQL